MLSSSLRRAFLLICLCILITSSSFAQNTRLTYRPIRAEWSAALQRIVSVSTGPNQLSLFNPQTRTSDSVALGATPVSLSISPNGLFAAVGHVGSATYVDLTNRTVVRTYTYPAPGSGQGSTEVALASEWLYVLPAYSGDAISIRLSTGVATSLPSDYSSGARLHPSGKAIYTTRDGISPNDIQRYSVTDAGTLVYKVDSIYHGDYNFCGPVWFSPDGSRIYNGCGTVVRYDVAPEQDMRYAGRFALPRVQSFSESPAGRIAAIPTDPENKVLLINGAGYQEQGRLSIPEFVVGARTYRGNGRWVFFSNDGAALHVVYQAETSSGLLNDFAVQTYELANPATCTVTFPTPTLSAGSDGGLRTVELQAAADCIYNAVSNADWVQILTGGYGSGTSTISLHIRTNTALTARTGTISVGSQSLQITQSAAPATVPTQQIFSYKIVDAEFSKALDRVVLVSTAPNELHLYDPQTRADQMVPLAYPALSLNVSPSGLKAAVGHQGFVSIVNLQTRAVEKVITTGINGAEVMLTGDTWLYVFASSGAQVIEIANSDIRTLTVNAAFARLHASRNFAYIPSPYSYGWWKLDVRNGSNTPPPFSINTNLSLCSGGLWVSEDGGRLYTGCGAVYRSTDSLSEDSVPNGTLSAAYQVTSVGWVAHSASRQQIALLTGDPGYYTQSASADVQLYADDGLPLLGRVRLASRVDGPTTFQMRGRWLFWNAAANRLYAIAQATSSSQQTPPPESDYSLEVISPETLAACSVTVNPLSVNIPGGGGSTDLTVQSGSACVWSGTIGNNSYWLRFSNYSSSSSITGNGNATVTIVAERNNGTTSRTGTINLGGATIAFNQPLPNPLTVSPLTASVSSSQTTNNIFVTASGVGVVWSAVSNASWITLLNGPNFVGTASVQYRVAANTGPARSGTMTIAGETVRVDQAAPPLTGGMRFVPVVPCRVVDTRSLTGETGAFGLPVMAGGSQRDFPVPQQTRCNIPSNAAAYSLNATVVPRGPLAYLTLWPAGQARPLASTLNSFDGRIKANAAIIPAGTGGAISAFVTDQTDLILDINGYFVANSVSGAPFYSLTPCRVADTRTGQGGPPLLPNSTWAFPIANTSNATIPASAIAYSLNITAIPRSSSLGYLTVWPWGADRPIVSTLNSPTGTVVANAAIVPSGLNGSVNIFATDFTDIVIDINGYFGGSGNGPALSFFPLTPCRVTDSRNAVGEFGGPVLTAGATRSYTIPSSTCAISTSARAYSMNATVVPPGPLSYLTLWPTGLSQPVASSLNSFDGSVVANAVLVPAGTNGAISAYVTNQTHLILDINGFFAQ